MGLAISLNSFRSLSELSLELFLPVSVSAFSPLSHLLSSHVTPPPPPVCRFPWLVLRYITNELHIYIEEV
jgi:hypothetical protein